MLSSLSSAVKQYLVVTGNYWAFTITDGALRMLVVLHFHQLGYDALSIAMLFLFYEIFGVVTNLFGGWLGARVGLNRTMNIGLFMQVVALLMLALPASLSVAWVMLAQALSGIAKDLNKMSAKSSIKTLVPEDAQDSLFKWVAILTGSKNALKGFGFFLGALLLSLLGFADALLAMATALAVVSLASLVLLKAEMGRASFKPKFKDLFSKSTNLNYLSGARLCLFAARDVWFVVALPVYFSQQLAWDHWQVGTFMATWVIIYGFIQSIAPKITGAKKSPKKDNEANVAINNGNSAALHAPRLAVVWGLVLAITTLVLLVSFVTLPTSAWVLVIGLLLFGAAFAINSSLHSYLVVSLARGDGVSLDVGFYYMANAMGRLLGTVLSGWLFVQGGLALCLLVSVVLLFGSAATVTRLKPAAEIK